MPRYEKETVTFELTDGQLWIVDLEEDNAALEVVRDEE
jgi:hypothetical protein